MAKPEPAVHTHIIYPVCEATPLNLVPKLAPQKSQVGRVYNICVCFCVMRVCLYGCLCGCVCGCVCNIILSIYIFSLLSHSRYVSRYIQDYFCKYRYIYLPINLSIYACLCVLLNEANYGKVFFLGRGKRYIYFPLSHVPLIKACLSKDTRILTTFCDNASNQSWKISHTHTKKKKDFETSSSSKVRKRIFSFPTTQKQ